MKNRRNYYRILHVQHDAPTEIIKSSYRALMLNMEMHPDRGGEHWSAALINEAFATLSNPAKRAEYDRTLERATGKPPAGQAAASDTASRERPSADPGDCCVFCGHARSSRAPVARDECCAKCDSPMRLVDAAIWNDSGRRAATRLERCGRIVYFTDWPQARGREGILGDLSPTGMRVIVDEPLQRYLIVKIESSLIEATARVVRTSPREGRYSIGLEFFTVRFPKLSGTFLSVHA